MYYVTYHQINYVNEVDVNVFIKWKGIVYINTVSIR